MNAGRRTVSTFAVRGLRASLLVALLWPGVAAAMDLFGALQLARERDPIWLAARHERRAATEQKKQANAGYLPQVELDYDHTFTRQRVLDSQVVVYTKQETKFLTRDLSLVLRQPVLRVDRIAEIDRADAKVKAAEVTLAKEGQSLIVRVAERYLELLRATDDLTFTDAELKAVAQNAELVEQKRRSGLVRSTDLLDARARLAATQASVAEAQQKLVDAESGLRQVLGELPGRIEPLGKQFKAVAPDPPDPKAWVEAGVEQNLSVQVKRYEVEAARAELERRRAGHFPTVDLVAHLNRKDTGDSLFGGSSNIDTYDVGVQLRLPLFAGGRTTSEVREATELLGVAQEELGRETRRVDRETRDAYQRILSALVRIDALEKAVEAQRLSRESKQQGYNAGLFTLIAVLDADRDLTSARRDLSRARYDYLLNTLRLKEQVGSLDDDDVREVNAMFAGATPDPASSGKVARAP